MSISLQSSAILYHNYVQYLEDMLQDPNLQGMLRSLRVCIYVSTIGCIGGAGGGVARPPRGSIRRTPTPPSSLLPPPFPSLPAASCSQRGGERSPRRCRRCSLRRRVARTAELQLQVNKYVGKDSRLLQRKECACHWRRRLSHFKEGCERSRGRNDTTLMLEAQKVAPNCAQVSKKNTTSASEVSQEVNH